MLSVLKFLWTLPQNIIALIVIFIYKGKKTGEYKECKIYSIRSSFLSGASLGNYIILEQIYFKNGVFLEKVIKHEYGHYLQGLMFGWLYLLIIGLPSAMNNLIARVNKNVALTYYKRYPENWADKLGGVER